MDSFFSDIELAYQTHIEAAGKEFHFLILLAFLLSWGFIRTSAHMIHAQVSWWPGNVQTKGGTHIHHLVWGILLVLSMGYLGLSFDLAAPWIELVAIGFGIGMGSHPRRVRSLAEPGGRLLGPRRAASRSTP